MMFNEIIQIQKQFISTFNSTGLDIIKIMILKHWPQMDYFQLFKLQVGRSDENENNIVLAFLKLHNQQHRYITTRFKKRARIPLGDATRAFQYPVFANTVIAHKVTTPSGSLKLKRACKN